MRVLWLAALAHASADYAVASMRGAKASYNVSGSVSFEQGTDLGDMTVTFSMTGLTDGAHGFHVHQFGDTRVTDSLSTMSAHFVPFCLPPEVDDQGNKIGGCEDDQQHGYPPSVQRQPGDMGNISSFGGVAQSVLTLGQGKMSLKEAMRSIVGRVVVVHSNADDGTQPCKLSWPHA